MYRYVARSSRPLGAMVTALLVVVSASCSDHMPIEEARQAAVAEVDGAVLTGADLERYMMLAPQAPSEEIAATVISTFIDAATLRSALLGGSDLLDSVTVAAAIEPDAIRGMLKEALDRRAAAMPVSTDGVVDSVARLGNARVFQHILFGVTPDADSATAFGTASTARSVLTALQTGNEDFTAAVRRHSSDTLTRSRNGYLPAATRSDFPDGNFGNVIWRLQPGEISSIILSGLGLHVFRRATVEESREGVREWLAPRLARTADSIWLDSLTSVRKVVLADKVAPRIRELAAEPIHEDADAPYASWDGGELSARAVRMWLSVVPAGERARLTVAPDSAVSLMLREFSQRELAYEVLVGGSRVSPRAWEQLAPQFRDAVGSMTEAYRSGLTAGSGSEAVNGFLDNITLGRMPYRPMPGALSMVLRDRSEVSVDRRAMRAVILAAVTEWSRRQDSAAAAQQ